MLKNREELLERLVQYPEGIEVENLKDSYKGIETDIDVTLLSEMSLIVT